MYRCYLAYKIVFIYHRGLSTYPSKPENQIKTRLAKHPEIGHPLNLKG